MPLYAYRCTSCGHKFEKIQSFSAEPVRECPKCGGTVERPLTAPRFQFKGAGWYINDYASTSSENTAESSAESKPAESKDAAKSTEKPAAAPSAPATSSTPAAAPSASKASSTTNNGNS